jgi:hypothetical protein
MPTKNKFLPKFKQESVKEEPEVLLESKENSKLLTTTTPNLSI